MEVLPFPVALTFSHADDFGHGMRETSEEMNNSASEQLKNMIESELRAAKSAQLAFREIFIPRDLFKRISVDILRMAENEPCGLKGCTLYINFELERECRQISRMKIDRNTVSTFELYLTLKKGQDRLWHDIPSFFRYLLRGGEGRVWISEGFTLEKTKLYRSYANAE